MTGKRQKLGDAELTTLLQNLPGWSVVQGKLHREYQFRDFVEAWGFMTSAALVIQAMDHHPEWSNVYHKVTIDLNTHDVGGLTLTDTELAGKIEEIAGRLLKK